MGGGLEEMGDIAGSMAEYKKCLAIEEHVYKDANVHYELGRLYSKQNNLPEAIKHNRRCLELNPHLVECVVNLGAWCVVRGAWCVVRGATTRRTIRPP